MKHLRIPARPHRHEKPWIGGQRKLIETHLRDSHGYIPSQAATSDPWETHRQLHEQEETPMPTSSISNQEAATVPSAEEAHRQIQRLERTALDFRAERDDLKDQLGRLGDERANIQRQLDELRGVDIPTHSDLLRQITDLEEALEEARADQTSQFDAKMRMREQRNDAKRALIAAQGERDELLRTRDAVAASLRQRHHLLIEEMRGDIQSARSEADQARHQLTVATDHNIELQRQLNERPPLVVLTQKQVDKLLKAKAKVDPRA